MASINHLHLANSFPTPSSPDQVPDFEGFIEEPQTTRNTQAEIVTILSQDPEKLDDSFDTLDTSVKSPTFANVEGISASLNKKGITIDNPVADVQSPTFDIEEDIVASLNEKGITIDNPELVPQFLSALQNKERVEFFC